MGEKKGTSSAMSPDLAFAKLQLNKWYNNLLIQGPKKKNPVHDKWKTGGRKECGGMCVSGILATPTRFMFSE